DSSYYLFPYTTLFRSFSVRQGMGPVCLDGLTPRASLHRTHHRSTHRNKARQNAEPLFDGFVNGDLPVRWHLCYFKISSHKQDVRSEEHTSELQSRFDL